MQEVQAKALVPKRDSPELRSWRPRVRCLSVGALVLEVLAIALVTCANYGWSTEEFSESNTRHFVFYHSVFDLHVIYAVLLLLQTAVFWSLPTGDLPYQGLYLAQAIVGLYVVVKISLFEWTSDPVPALLLITILLFIRVAPIVVVHREVKRIAVENAELYEVLNQSEQDEENGDVTEAKAELTVWQLVLVLRPYFWPSDGADSAFMNRIRSCSTWLCVGASKACSITAPLFLANALNALSDENLRKTYVNAGIYVSLLFATSFFKEMQNLVYLKVKQQAYIEIAQRTFAHLHTLSLQWHLKKKTGGVLRSMDRGTDGANTLVTYLFLYLVPAMAECIAVCIVFVIVFNEWHLALLVFGGVSVYAYLTVKVTLWRKKFREATNKHDNDFHDKATDSVINYETVKYFTNELFEVKRFTDSVIEYMKNSTNTQASLSLLNILQSLVIQATAVGCMIIAAKAVIDGTMNIGDFVAVNAYVLSVFTPLAFLGSVYNAIITALVDMRNLSQLLAEQPDVTDLPGAFALPIRPNGMSIEFRNVHFNYPEQPVSKGLKGISFIVSPGTTTAVVGHTGAGKTTISRLLFRFYDPTKGQVLLGGIDIKSATQTSVRGVIGVVPQDTVMFNETILHNLKYGRMTATMEEVEAAAEAAQIRTFIESLPEKWNTFVGERGLKLSGGEKQRVAIARCLLKDPPIVLLDEATSALDTRTEASIQDALQKLGNARTTLIIAHRLSTIKHADQIIVLDNGVIVERGTHEELMNVRGDYFGLWQMQLREEKNNLVSEEESKANVSD